MFTTTRHRCHACRAVLELTGRPGRRDECVSCGAELHVCLNCSHHDPSLSRGCREPQAEEVRDLSRANFCSWFEFRRAAADSSPEEDPAEQARRAFDSLFRR